jgi:predicted Zn-dependent protease
MAAVVAALIAACTTIPETGRSTFFITSPKQEAEMGIQSFKDIKKSEKISKDPAANAQVKRVAGKLIKQVSVPNAKWEIVVFEDPTPNAFALPGGKIGVNTGILKITQNDDALAAVLGHELAHVTLRHGGERMTAQFATQLGYTTMAMALQNEDYKTQQFAGTAFGVGSQVFGVLPFSRYQESEADRVGIMYAAKAGYDPREAVAFWERMEAYGSQHGGSPPEFLSTHPADQSRIEQLKQLMPSAMAEYQRNKS